MLDLQPLSTFPTIIPDRPTPNQPTTLLVMELSCDRTKINLDLDFRRGSINQAAMFNIVVDDLVNKGGKTYLNKLNIKGNKKLSIGSMNSTYLMIVLENKSKMDWQFSYNDDPFSVSEKSLNVDSFGQARKIDQKGNIISKGEPKDGCMIAYFSVDGLKMGQYNETFNINLEILERDSTGNIIQRIPIIIDPDIKWPGGSQP